MEVCVEPCVEDLMTRDVFTLQKSATLDVLEEVLQWRNIRHVPVVDDDGVLEGIVTHRDFLRAAISTLSGIDRNAKTEVYSKVPVAAIMTNEVMSIGPETPLQKAAVRLWNNKIGCLPVVNNDGVLIGILTEADFVKAFTEWDVSLLNDV